MNNETKWDVFVRLAEDLKINDSFDEEYPKSQEYIEKKYKENIHNYDAALPDDMPVIPKEVGEYIQWGKKYDIQLYMMYYYQLIHRPGFKKLTDDAISWIISSSNIFARAWVLGAWRVEKTGEIIKLEDEK